MKNKTETKYPAQHKFRRKLLEAGFKQKNFTIPISLESEFEIAARKLKNKYETFHNLFLE